MMKRLPAKLCLWLDEHNITGKALICWSAFAVVLLTICGILAFLSPSGDRIFPVYINDGPGGKVSLSSLELIHDAAGMEIICRELPSGKVLDHVRLEKGKNFSVKKTTFIKY